ncbi:MAG: hypothetical protein WDN30_10320 [Pararobbsia sp.]
MKKTDLEKNKGLKLTNSMRQAATYQAGGPADAGRPDRREQRRLDQLKGLIPFACKLEESLVERLKQQAATHPEGLNGLVGELLTAGLDALPSVGK